MPGGVSNTSGNAGALFAPARPQHCGYTGGGNLPLPRCPWCDIQVSRKALNGRHLETSKCRTGTEQKRRKQVEAELETTSEKAFHPYGTRIRAVTGFKYLGRVLTNTDVEGCPGVSAT